MGEEWCELALMGGGGGIFPFFSGLYIEAGAQQETTAKTNETPKNFPLAVLIELRIKARSSFQHIIY